MKDLITEIVQAIVDHPEQVLSAAEHELQRLASGGRVELGAVVEGAGVVDAYGIA